MKILKSKHPPKATQSPARPTMFSEPAVWIPLGMLIGSLVDTYLYNTTIGRLHHGFLAGVAASLAFEEGFELPH